MLAKKNKAVQKAEETAIRTAFLTAKIRTILTDGLLIKPS